MPDQVPAQIFMSHNKYTAVATAILVTNTLLICFVKCTCIGCANVGGDATGVKNPF